MFLVSVVSVSVVSDTFITHIWDDYSTTSVITFIKTSSSLKMALSYVGLLLKWLICISFKMLSRTCYSVHASMLINSNCSSLLKPPTSLSTSISLSIYASLSLFLSLSLSLSLLLVCTPPLSISHSYALNLLSLCLSLSHSHTHTLVCTQ